MKIYCPECGALIAAEDINLDNGLAKCRQCQAVFSYAGAAQQEGQRVRQPPAGAAAGSPALQLPRPARMQVEEFAGTWAVSWRWFTPVYLFLTFFCVAWDSFLVFWYAAAFGDSHAPWLMIVFPVAHVAVGVGLTYTVVCGYVNSTRISVDSTELAVTHGPLPWFGDARFSRSDLKQLFCEQTTSTSNRNNSSTTTTTYSYTLSALLRDGSKRKVVSGLTEVSDARYLEQQLERHLGIANQPVAGEY